MLALFENELQGQRFGDLDEAALRALAEDLQERSTVVEEARAVLETARAEHEAARAALLARAEQSLAYARIYAASLGEDEGGEGLVAHLDALTTRPKAKAKTRRPKVKKAAKPEAPSEGELPFAAAS